MVWDYGSLVQIPERQPRKIHPSRRSNPEPWQKPSTRRAPKTTETEGPHMSGSKAQNKGDSRKRGLPVYVSYSQCYYYVYLVERFQGWT